MKRFITLCLPLSIALLSACGPTTPSVVIKPTSDDVPSVPRAARPAQANCAQQSLAEQLSGGNLARLRYQSFTPSLQAQASGDTLAALLLSTRKALNSKYYGFSAVDLQALHETWETRFRKSFGNLQQGIPNAADDLMTQYVTALNDEHTFYLDPEQYRAFTGQGNGAPTPKPKFGFQSAAVPSEDGAVVLDVGVGTPAQEAGLKRGDTILSINGVGLKRSGSDDTSSQQYAAQLAAVAIQGRSTVLSIRRGETPLSVTVTPRIISSSAEPSGYLLGSVYVLRLPSFASNGTAQQVHILVQAAQKTGATSLILDLRGNRGGLVSEATGVSAAFAPSRAGQTLAFLDAQDYTYFYEGSSNIGKIAVRGTCVSGSVTLTAINNPAYWTGKLAVLINAQSASASEVVTETLQQAGVSAFGEITTGVGNTATTISELPSSRGMSITVARSSALDGQYLTAKVAPTVNMGEDLRALAHGRDVLLEAALSQVK